MTPLNLANAVTSEKEQRSCSLSGWGEEKNESVQNQGPQDGQGLTKIPWRGLKPAGTKLERKEYADGGG